MTCDMGTSAAKAARGAAPVIRNRLRRAAKQPDLADFPRTKPSPSPGPAPEGMVWIPGGEFWMGRRSFRRPTLASCSVDGFWMDKTEVTNDQSPSCEGDQVRHDRREGAARRGIPGAAGKSRGWIGGLSPPDHAVKPNDHFQWWNYVKGANWRHPEGPDSDIKDGGNTRSSTSPTTMPWPMRNGPASVCRPRPNSNSRRAADSTKSPTPGAMNEARRQVHGEHVPGAFPRKEDEKTAMSVLPPVASFRLMAMALRHGRQRVGMDERLVSPRLLSDAGRAGTRSRGIRKDRRTASTPASPA